MCLRFVRGLIVPLIGAGLAAMLAPGAASIAFDAGHDGLACAAGFSCEGLAVDPHEARLALGHDDQAGARAAYDDEYGWYRDGLGCAAGLGCGGPLTQAETQLVLGLTREEARARHDRTYAPPADPAEAEPQPEARQPIDDFDPTGLWRNRTVHTPIVTKGCGLAYRIEEAGGAAHDIVRLGNGDILFGRAYYTRTPFTFSEIDLVTGWCSPLAPNIGNPLDVPLDEARLYYHSEGHHAPEGIPYLWLAIGEDLAFLFERDPTLLSGGWSETVWISHALEKIGPAAADGSRLPVQSGPVWTGRPYESPPERGGAGAGPPLPPLDLGAAAIHGRLSGLPACAAIDRLILGLAFTRNQAALEIVRGTLAAHDYPATPRTDTECAAILREIGTALTVAERGEESGFRRWVEGR